MFAEKMQRLVMDNGGELIVEVSNTINLTTAIRSAAKRAFPKFKKTVTAYSFRHQAAADWKADALSSANLEEKLIEVSAMLGHATDITKGRYGHSSQGRGGLMPESVVVTRDIKIIKKTSYKKNSSRSPKPS